MRDALIVNLLSVVPRNRAAAWMGALARSPLSRWGTRLFVRAYGVDLSEAEWVDLTEEDAVLIQVRDNQFVPSHFVVAAGTPITTGMNASPY